MVPGVISLFPKSPLPDTTLLRGTEKSFLSSASLWFLKCLHSLARALDSLSPSSAAAPESPPFDSTGFSFSGRGLEARMAVKGRIFPLQRIKKKEFPDPA